MTKRDIRQNFFVTFFAVNASMFGHFQITSINCQGTNNVLLNAMCKFFFIRHPERVAFASEGSSLAWEDSSSPKTRRLRMTEKNLHIALLTKRGQEL